MEAEQKLCKSANNKIERYQQSAEETGIHQVGNTNEKDQRRPGRPNSVTIYGSSTPLTDMRKMSHWIELHGNLLLPYVSKMSTQGPNDEE
ncbi:unnamed protein product [Clavelina lepadiformis]|uniref:Uncharacterized protein n=1 Tax=Clavelina lepadiformis TaxID=159417 RepID=A0ABP0F6K9_CLALP